MITQDYLRQVKKEEREMLEKQLKMIKIAKKLCCYLDDNNIKYDIVIRHKEVLGCNDASIYYKRFNQYLNDDYIICKNLLLREKKGEKRYFLIITDYKKQIDLNNLRQILDCKKLEFAGSYDMEQIINTTPGNVSLFNMIYDKKNKIKLVIDKELMGSKLAFHPLYNGMSMFIKASECLKFIDLIEKDADIVEIAEKKQEKVIEKKLK